MAMVRNINYLMHYLRGREWDERDIFMTSGGFDPIHVGHIRCIQKTAEMATNTDIYPHSYIGLVVVVVNGDSFLVRKKGYAFMPLKERMEIIDAIEGVDFVVPWETDEDQTVIGAIELLKPKFFTKGGDRLDATTIPEWQICQEVKCQIVTGVGGEKVQSSSTLVEESRVYRKE
jgi:cytidyltransferase-like protein